ncbi:autophagy related protein 14 [Oratosquilla oratoria]|uniref:autophagy related protein 14 n=1 Tax=Oratosquilla oratoria TaxID=337810 RepID=UPI003F767ABC
MFTNMSNQTTSDSVVPLLYKVSSGNEGYSARVSGQVERCPLCNVKSTAFYCKECVRNGDFCHSKKKNLERYAEKKIRLERLRRDLTVQEEEAKRLYTTSTRHLLLKEQKEEVKERLKLLRLILVKTKENIEHTKSQSRELEKNNAVLRLQLPDQWKRLQVMKETAAKKQERLQEKRQELQVCESQLKEVIRGNVKELVTYVFPITQVTPTTSSLVESDPAVHDTVSALAEASQTTYVRGRWVYTDLTHQTQYRIVHPLLPGSGDYSAYNLFTPGHTEDMEMEKEEQSHAHGICAGLTYLNQLVNILAFYLDVTLPKKICYSEFCLNKLSEAKFNLRVAQLNANVVYLCLSQNVPPHFIRPVQTVANVLALLDTQISDLGRQGAVDIAESIVESLDEMMVQDAEDSDSDEDTLSAEWETVPNIPHLEQSLVPTRQSLSSFNSTATYSQAYVGGAQGVGGVGAGGIMSSAAASVISLFKGFAGNQR